MPVAAGSRSTRCCSGAAVLAFGAEAVGDRPAADPQLPLLDLEHDVVAVEALHLAFDPTDGLDLVAELQRLGQLLLLLHAVALGADDQEDRKSTRLNSSHVK